MRGYRIYQEVLNTFGSFTRLLFALLGFQQGASHDRYGDFDTVFSRVGVGVRTPANTLEVCPVQKRYLSGLNLFADGNVS